jgi:hypothetical protein
MGPEDKDEKVAKMLASIQTLEKDDLISLINHYETVWALTEDKGSINVQHMVGFNEGQFFDEADIDKTTVPPLPKKIDMHVVEDKSNRLFLMFKHIGARLNVVFDDGKLLSKEHMDEMPALSLGERINRLIKQVSDAFSRVRQACTAMDRINEPRAAPERYDADPEYFSATPITSTRMDDMSPFQRSVCACLHETQLRGYRRYKGQCYQQVKTNGQITRAWEPVHTIKEFVYMLAQKEIYYERWKDMTSKGGTFNEVIRHLDVCNDHQFPEIVKDRHVWSFKNGLFRGKVWNEDLQAYTSKFYPYDSVEFQALDPRVVSSKYFDQEFLAHDHVTDWYEIPTPHFQSVLDYQRFETEVSKWVYVMVGRLCFQVGDLDGWQIIPFMKGIARSGKSTIITKVCKKFYEAEDVRTLSNNIETKFGLSSIYDGLMFIAPEIKGDIKLEQAEFQSIVSGEDVSLAVKHEKAKSMVWIVPGILAGNQIPDWKDNAGSILRRILPWNFGRQVKEADPHLDRKLDDELPVILEKCVRAYLDYAGKYGDKDIWNVVPKYFKKNQDEMAKNVSTLIHFLGAPEVRYGADLCIPQKEFVAMFNQHCMRNNLTRTTFTPDFYAGPFSTRDITVEIGTRMWEGRHFTNQPFIMGLTVDREDME